MTTDPAALATLRHELRTPLNHIIGYAELCLEEAGDGDAADLMARLRAIRDHARQVVGLITDLVGPAVSSVPSPAALRDRLAGPVARLGDAARELRAAAERASAAAPAPQRWRAAATSDGNAVRHDGALSPSRAHPDVVKAPL